MQPTSRSTGERVHSESRFTQAKNFVKNLFIRENNSFEQVAALPHTAATALTDRVTAPFATASRMGNEHVQRNLDNFLRNNLSLNSNFDREAVLNAYNKKNGACLSAFAALQKYGTEEDKLQERTNNPLLTDAWVMVDLAKKMKSAIRKQLTSKLYLDEQTTVARLARSQGKIEQFHKSEKPESRHTKFGNYLKLSKEAGDEAIAYLCKPKFITPIDPEALKIDNMTIISLGYANNKSMEDRVAGNMMKFSYKGIEHKIKYVGVLDGHSDNGSLAPDYVMKNIERVLTACLINQMEKNGSETPTKTDIANALKMTFVQLDKELSAEIFKVNQRRFENFEKFRKQFDGFPEMEEVNFYEESSGTTYTFNFQFDDEKTIWTASGGDSRSCKLNLEALANVEDEKSEQPSYITPLSRDHEASQPDAAKSVAKYQAGTVVIENPDAKKPRWMIAANTATEGELAKDCKIEPTRVLGDPEFGLSPKPTLHALDFEERTVILSFSDGLTQGATSEQIGEFLMRECSELLNKETLTKEDLNTINNKLEILFQLVNITSRDNMAFALTIFDNK